MITLRTIGADEAVLMGDLEEAIWPRDIQATPEQLYARVLTFPSGVVGVWIESRLVGFGTSQIVNYSEGMNQATLEKLLPRRGIVSEYHDPKGNCLHLMSGGVLPQYRRRGLWKLMVNYRIAVARLLQLKYVMVDSRMPSYLYRAPEFRTFSAERYSTALANGLPIDPYLAFFARTGFHIVCPSRSSYPDRESGDNWPFMVLSLNQT